jgi:hypothetical protein
MAATMQITNRKNAILISRGYCWFFKSVFIGKYNVSKSTNDAVRLTFFSYKATFSNIHNDIWDKKNMPNAIYLKLNMSHFQPYFIDC